MLSPPLKRSLKRSLLNCRTFTTKLCPKKGDKVIVAMSGGVDSSVTAGLLARQDYDLSAVFMRNWDTRDEFARDDGCEWKKDWADVQDVCKKLGIPCQMVDLSKQYWTRVFEPALKIWEEGGTPNPDVWCNKEVKFGALLDQLPVKDAWIATGHYARKSWSEPSSSGAGPSTPRPKLLRPSDRHKDQTYYLSSVSEPALSRAIFPIADLPKTEVRKLAKEWGLPTASRGESMGLCFVGEKKHFHDWLSQYIPPKSGLIIDQTTGSIIGEHDGLHTFTIGQNARIRGMKEKMFVSEKNPQTNEIFVVPGSKHPALMKKTIYANDWKWIWSDSPPPAIDIPEGFRTQLRFRHCMMDSLCTVRRGEQRDSLVIECDEPQHGVAPGQVAVLWDGDWCLGSGVIEKAR